MFWITPDLLKLFRYRLMTLLDLQRWSSAAADVSQFQSFYEVYTDRGDIDEGLKEAASQEFARMIAKLKSLTTEQRELVYAELNEDSEVIRVLVDEIEG